MEVDGPQLYLLGKTYLTNNENFYIRNDPIVHIAAGDRHTIIVTESGRAYAFGDNNSGQLGLGHTHAVERVSCIKSLKFGETGEKIILAACGRESSLVATNQGSLYAFGLNLCCQLGLESEESITIHFSPVKIEYFRSKMSWKQLAMGAEHTCVLTNDGQVYVWGSNEVGQCGLEHKYKIIKAPNELKLEYSVNAISCGYYHTALISEDGRLFLFGNNSDRQLGRSIPDQYIGPLEVSLPDPVHAVACGNEHTVVLTKKGDVYTCGRGDRGQLGLGRKVSIAKHFQMIEHLPKHLTAIAAGSTHTAIIDSCGGIYLFGDGKHGKLNYGSHSNKFEPSFSDQFKGYNVLDVVCGGCQTIIFAQRKSIINTVDSKTKSMENIIRINVTNSIDQTSKSKNSSLHLESVSNSDELPTSMPNALMNITHAGINGKLQPTSHFTKIESLEADALNNTANDLIISNNLKIKPKLDHKRSLSEERTISTSEQVHQKNPSVKNHYQDSRYNSSTTSGCTSSSISSLQDENLVTTRQSTDAIQHSFHSSAIKILDKPYKIDSVDKTITTKSKSRLLSRIFSRKSSQKLSITTHKNSKTCLIM